MLPAGDVSHLPPTIRAAHHASVIDFLGADRGVVRGGNDKTFDTRCRYFAAWLAAGGYDLDSARMIAPTDFIVILGAYLSETKSGRNLKGLSALTGQTLCGYIKGAATVLHLLTGHPCSYFDAATLHNQRPALHPYLAEQLSQRVAWHAPKPKKEPFTLPMFDALKRHLTEKSGSAKRLPTFLSQEYACYDWTRLGLFTGSRISEHGQVKIPPGTRYATVPSTHGAGIWGGTAVALIESDFRFYDSQVRLLPAETCLLSDAANLIEEVHIRYRFDKSRDNFTIRKYCHQPSAPFDPIIACINILRRASLLAIPKHEALGQFRNYLKGRNDCLRATHVTNVMRLACRLAYPDAKHYMRVHELRIIAHLNRVTAACCLKAGGATYEEIVFIL
jgi:hypothetical protein